MCSVRRMSLCNSASMRIVARALTILHLQIMQRADLAAGCPATSAELG